MKKKLVMVCLLGMLLILVTNSQQTYAGEMKSDVGIEFEDKTIPKKEDPTVPVTPKKIRVLPQTGEQNLKSKNMLILSIAAMICSLLILKKRYLKEEESYHEN